MSDRNQAMIFSVSVLAVSWTFEAFIITHGGVRSFSPQWLGVLMCIPGVLSVALRLVFKLGFADVRFKIGEARSYLYAVAIPLSAALLVGLTSAALDIRKLSLVSPGQFFQLGPMLASFLVLGLIFAFGEELGWRGFLLPKLMGGGVGRPYFFCGIVWALWHLPLIAFGGFYETDNSLLMALIYCLGIIAMSFVFSELRVRSGSIWIPAVAHAAHNFFFQLMVPVLLLTVPGSRSKLWDLVASDTGLSTAALYAVTFVVLRRIRGPREVAESRDDAFKRVPADG